MTERSAVAKKRPIQGRPESFQGGGKRVSIVDKLGWGGFLGEKKRKPE